MLQIAAPLVSSVSLSHHLHTPFSLFLISLMVSVDVKHHVYLLSSVYNYGVDGSREFSDSKLQNRPGSLKLQEEVSQSLSGRERGH